jgi:rubrerythrin
MILHTASESISFSKKLENDSAEFYEALARLNAGDAETLLSFARENKKNISQIERAYYGVITDAIEGGYAFNLDPDIYSLKTTIGDVADYTAALKQAVEIEKTIIKFYTDAAEQSRPLMADVPRAFTAVVKKRTGRLEKLDALLNK